MSTSVNKQWPSVGMHCVCVKGGTWSVDGVGPKYGDKLTVRSIYADGDEVYLRFEEWVTPPQDTKIGLIELGYFLPRFRPIITKSQPEDVRMFKSLLREMPASERLDRLAELLNE